MAMANQQQGTSSNINSQQSENVLQFWFPDQLDWNLAALLRQWQRWFRGGANADITKHFSQLLEQATQGELDNWAWKPRPRLALIIILDQFSRTIYRGTALAFAQDPKACRLALEGINIGHYAALETPCEKTFYLLPLGHCEASSHLANLDLAIKLADELVQEAPQEYRALLEFSAAQARAHRDVITKFGRHPHRNEVLGRCSTSEELECLATGQLVHTRSMPPHLSKFLVL